MLFALMNVSCYFSEAAFIAGISGHSTTLPYHFDVAILNPGGHFDPSDASYHVPYDGLYQFTISISSYTDAKPKFFLKVDGVFVASTKNYDDIDHENSLSLTRNLLLEAGQVVKLDVSEINGVYGQSGGGVDGVLSWFTGHLIYPD